MVRIIIGTLVEVGQGRKSVDDVSEALESGQRKLAGITAPAHGLYALNVIYPQGMIQWPLEVIDN
jgi:tRNA pseudouridine38-40 synthase